MDATQVTRCIAPLSDLLLPTHDAAVVAGVAGEVNPPSTTVVVLHTGQQVDVSRQVSGCVDNVETPVLEDIEQRRRIADDLPGSGEYVSADGILALDAWIRELDGPGRVEEVCFKE